MKIFLVLIVLVVAALAGPLVAQTLSAIPQLALDNDVARVLRVTLPPRATFPVDATTDVVAVRLQDETATFIPKGTHAVRSNSSDHEVVDLLIEPKQHWDAPVRPCSAPMNCTRTTKMGNDPIAWTTTLFTNGFLTAATHRVVPGGTLDSFYYSAKGSDAIVVVPFTEISANFGGIDETLKAGQPYFSTATEAEVTGTNAEGRWFVLRINSPNAKK